MQHRGFASLGEMAGAECGEPARGGQTAPNPLQISSSHNIHWSRHLKCQVCYSYLQQPHTLQCGHTFCRGCLIRLGQTARAVNSDVPIRHLKLPCPSCRTLFPASNFLRGTSSTSFLIQNLITDWRREKKRLQSNSTVTLRSICTQTATHQRRLRRRKSPSPQDLHEEFHVRMRADDQFMRSLLNGNSDSSDEAESKVSQLLEMQIEPSVIDSDTSTISSISSIRGFRLGGHRFADLGYSRRVHDWSPGRVLLMSIWCMYSLVVVGLAQSLLPYMVLVTLFFLIIVLR